MSLEKWTTRDRPKLPPLCQKCVTLFEATNRKLPCYHHTFPDLQQSAQSCQICALAYAQVKEAYISHHLDDQRPFKCKLFKYGRYRFLLFFPGDGEIEDEEYCSSRMLASLAMVRLGEERGAIQHDTEHTNTGAPQNIALAKEWLKICRDTHPECQQVSNAQHSLPSRLLSIGLQPQDQLRLCLTATLLSLGVRDIQYATLSHCWGTHSFLKLTHENFTSFQSSISTETLPKTFQDAIGIAREFGFQYLWIDSLCIIQDDREDWEMEAPRMAHVYGGSGLNIAATGAKDGTEGLFFERDVGLVRRILVEAEDWSSEGSEDEEKEVEEEEKEEMKGKKGKTEVENADRPRGEFEGEWESEDNRKKNTLKYLMSASESVDITGDAEGTEQAVGLQGLSLAREEVVPSEGQATQTTIKKSLKRLIYCIEENLYDRNFTESSLVRRAWVFQERVLAPRTLHFGKTQIMWECQSETSFETLPNGMDKRISMDGGRNWVMARKEGFEISWNTVIAQYSKCFLTQETDKLLAVSGIAEDFSKRYGGNYLWGLWTEHFPHNILWTSVFTTNTRPLKPRAPTWSWISVEGGIRPAAVTYKEASCEIIKTNTFVGASDHWFITIKCEKLLKIANMDRYVDQDDIDYAPMYSVYLSSAEKPRGLNLDISADENTLDHRDSTERYYLMCIHEADNDFEIGMVLQAVEGRNGYFRRLGVYESFSYRHSSSPAELRKERRCPATDDELLLYAEKYAKEGSQKQMYLINLM